MKHYAWVILSMVALAVMAVLVGNLPPREASAQEGSTLPATSTVVNLRVGARADCPNPGNFQAFGCSDTDDDGVNETPTPCLTGVKYTVPPGRMMKITDMMTFGTGSYIYVWSNLRGIMMRFNGEGQWQFTNPLAFSEYETVCIGGDPDLRATITGRLEQMDDSVAYGASGLSVIVPRPLPAIPMLSKIGLVSMALVMGVAIGWRMKHGDARHSK